MNDKDGGCGVSLILLDTRDNFRKYLFIVDAVHGISDFFKITDVHAFIKHIYADTDELKIYLSLCSIKYGRDISYTVNDAYFTDVCQRMVDYYGFVPVLNPNDGSMIGIINPRYALKPNLNIPMRIDITNLELLHRLATFSRFVE